MILVGRDGFLLIKSPKFKTDYPGISRNHLVILGSRVIRTGNICWMLMITKGGISGALYSQGGRFQVFPHKFVHDLFEAQPNREKARPQHPRRYRCVLKPSPIEFSGPRQHEVLHSEISRSALWVFLYFRSSRNCITFPNTKSWVANLLLHSLSRRNETAGQQYTLPLSPSLR